jgi:hypothetical protein
MNELRTPEYLAQIKARINEAEARIRKILEKHTAECSSAVEEAEREAYRIFSENVHRYGRIEDGLMITWLYPMDPIISFIVDDIERKLCLEKISTQEEAKRETLRELAEYFRDEAISYREKLDEIEDEMRWLPFNSFEFYELNRERKYTLAWYAIYRETARELHKRLGLPYQEERTERKRRKTPIEEIIEEIERKENQKNIENQK